MITEDTHEHCDVILTLGVCNSRTDMKAGNTRCYPGRRHPDGIVFRRLERCVREKEIVTTTALVNAGLLPRTVWTPVNKDVTTAAVKGDLWRCSRDIAKVFELSKPRVLKVLRDHQLHPHHYSRSAHLVLQHRPLRMQFCEWLSHYTVGKLLSHNSCGCTLRV
jgi:hypothetical protein